MVGRQQLVHAVRWLCGVLMVLALLPACQQKSVDYYEGTAACDSFMEILWGENMNGRTSKMIERIDSFYNTVSNPTSDALLKKFEFKTDVAIQTHRYDYARKCLDSLYVLVTENKWDVKNSIKYRVALRLKGQLMYETGNYDTAYNYYFKVKVFNEARKDTCGMGDDCYDISMSLYNQKRYREAADYFIASYKLRSRCSYRAGTNFQETINDIGLCYEKMGAYDSAIFYYDSAIAHMARFDKGAEFKVMEEKSRAVAWGNKGGVFLKKNQPDTALYYLNKSYYLNILPFHDNHDALLTHIKILRAWVAKRNTDSSAFHGRLIKLELDSIAHKLQPLADWQQLMSQHFELMGLMDSAYFYAKQYIHSNDSLIADERKVQAQGVLNGIRQKEDEHRIALLSRESALNQRALLLAIIILALVLVIVYMVYTNYLKSKRSVEQLVALNEIVTSQKQELEQRHKEKDRIMRVVAHDLRSPVGGISYMLDMLKMKHEDYDTDTLEIIRLMQNTSADALGLINELLNYSNEIATAVQPVLQDIVAILRSNVNLMQLKAAEKQQKISLLANIDKLEVMVDREKIGRVLQNILGNAIKFSKQGDTITIQLLHNTEGVTIQITDTGIGIPAEALAEIFDMLTTARRAGTAGEKSYGLGLSISRQIVEAHSGRIWVESTVGAGTTFYIWLPL